MVLLVLIVPVRLIVVGAVTRKVPPLKLIPAAGAVEPKLKLLATLKTPCVIVVAPV